MQLLAPEVSSAAAAHPPPDETLPREMSGFRGYHEGESIIVCGCGNSLSQLTDPGRFITIGVNDVGRLFDPTYLLVLNPQSQFSGDRFLYVRESRARALFTQLNLGVPHPHLVRFKLGQRGSAIVPESGALPYTRNSPYVAMCLARYFGATRIGLTGVDFTDHHFFGKTGRHPLVHTLKQIDQEYKDLAAQFARDGVEVFNLSEESRLTSLPKISLEDFAAGSRTRRRAGTPLRVVQVAKTNCAGAIWRLHEVLNRYTDHECRTITLHSTTNGRSFQTDVLFSQRAQVEQLLTAADVIHFHNGIDPDDSLLYPYRALLQQKRKVLQYHTEPALLASSFRGKDPAQRSDLTTLVIAQKHARFYPRSRPVPNVLDIDDALLKPSSARTYAGGPLKLFYAPTDRNSYADYTHTCRGKGYRETLPILRRLEQEGLLQLTVIERETPWEKLMPIKREHDVCIDEVVTGGYHLSSLEALSQGLVTIAHLDRATRSTIDAVVGRETELPWFESTAATLEADLRRLCALDPQAINARKAAGRAWMEAHWHPARLAQHFVRCYQREQPRPAQLHEVFRHARLLPVYDRPAGLQQDLRDLQGTWKYRQVVIWGNGPSARGVKTVWEPDAAHIGVNASWPHLREKFDAYCVSDQRFVNGPEKRAIVEGAPGVRVYLAHMRDVIPNQDGINFISTLGAEGICADLTKGAFHGYSVVWLALQVALWAGSTDILLVGCEQNYGGGQLRCYEDSKPTPVDKTTINYILNNYRRAMPLLQARGIRLHTVGESRLQTAGVPRLP
jgi:hypothetical protein